METVYLETTVVSYLSSRPSRDLIVAGHQQVTREWWERYRPGFRCFISQAVEDEVAKGDSEQVARRMAIVRALPKLPVTTVVAGLAGQILSAHVLPAQSLTDAVHIAVATVAQVDYLLTWNCRHIANARVLRRIARMCELAGYRLPSVCTPAELMDEEGESGDV